jgi:hypothetical protein
MDLKPHLEKPKTYNLKLQDAEIPTLKGAYRSRIARRIRENDDFNLDELSDLELALGDVTTNDFPLEVRSEDLTDIVATLESFAEASVEIIRDQTRSTATPDHENDHIISTLKRGKTAKSLADSIRTEVQIVTLGNDIAAQEPTRSLNFDAPET